MRAILLTLLLMPWMASHALDRRDVRGLDMRMEPPTESMEVDGVPIAMQRVTGSGVAELARRVEQRWTESGSEVRRLSHGDWQLLSRWSDGHSEVIQWRGVGARAELLFSSLDPRQRLGRMPPPPVDLPPQCVWGRQIEESAPTLRYRQRTARCRGSVRGLLSALRAALVEDGWILSAGRGNQLHAARAGWDADLVIVEGRNALECWLMWVDSRSARGMAP